MIDSKITLNRLRLSIGKEFPCLLSENISLEDAA
jgi:hypothetical protein